MGCCLFALVLGGAPRIAFLLWWLFQPVRVNASFTNFFIPLLGVIFLPWLTLSWVLVFPGGITGFDWVILGLALALDISSYVSGGRGQQQRSMA